MLLAAVWGWVATYEQYWINLSKKNYIIRIAKQEL